MSSTIDDYLLLGSQLIDGKEQDLALRNWRLPSVRQVVEGKGNPVNTRKAECR